LLKISKENVSGFIFKSFIYRILNNWFLGYHKAKKRNLSLGTVVNGTVSGHRTERNEDQNNYLEPEDLNENEVLEPEDLNENEVLEPEDLNNNEVLLELANDEELKKSERRSLKKREKGAISLSLF
jgi:DNA-directed RNA polymerase specialized sigma24 family protein